MALSAQTYERGSSIAKVSLIAKDLMDSEDPKHTLFCRETAFTGNYDIFVARNL